MKNLGKIFFILFLLQNILNAEVIASLDSNVAYEGEVLNYTLSISGNNIDKPQLSSICGNPVSATSSQTNIEMINGNYSKKYTLSYQFTPKASCTIAKTKVRVDGVIEESNELELKLKKASTEPNAAFTLAIKSSKESLYVGEPFEVILTLKQKRNAQVVDSQFEAPDFQGFWIKSEGKAQRKDDGAYITTKVLYKLAPQREGNLSIKAAKINIASRENSRDMWGNFRGGLKWRSYFSNELSFEVKPLPNAATLIGNFTLNATIDKKEINANEAVNLTIKVVGEGNLEDIKSFKPYIKGVNIFDEKIDIEGNTLTQKLLFVSDRSFTIAPFTLSYFNQESQKVEQLKTEPFAIKVNNASTPQELEIKRDTPVVEDSEVVQKSQKSVESDYNTLALIVAFVVGIVVGAFLMWIKPLIRLKKEKRFDFKDRKLLLMKLLPYKEDAEVKALSDALEKNIYENGEESIDKRVIKRVIERYSLS